MDSETLGRFFASHWRATIEKSKQSRALEPSDFQEMHTLHSWEALQTLLQDPMSDGLAAIKPALNHYNTFMALFETKLGPTLDSAFFWGVLGVLMQSEVAMLNQPYPQVSCENPKTIRTIIRVLRSIGYKAGSFNTCYAAMNTMTGQMKEACFDMQVQILEFFIDAIKCMRDELSAGGNTGREDPLTLLERHFLSMNRELNEILTRVEKSTQYGVPMVVQGKSSPAPYQTSSQTKPYLLLPPTRPLPGRFFDRTDVFEKLDLALGHHQAKASFKAIALWGMAGVGKSSIAISYIDLKVQKQQYNAIFWANAENSASLRQSFTSIAMKLKLPNAHPQNHDENLELVQEWFQSTKIYTWDYKTGSEFLFFLLKKEVGKDIDTEGISALELSKRLSGHALSITHMAGLIQRRSWSITEFTSIYLKDPRRAHNNELQRLWEFSFKSMERESQMLLGTFSFLMPDSIPQNLFEIHEELLPQRLKFCGNEFSFSETVESLLVVSLIKRNRDTRVFSIHRMVQTQFRYFLDAEELQSSFDDTVTLVYHCFPRQNDEKTQLYDQWTQCNALLQHVIFLKDCFQECHAAATSFKATWEFCDLLVQCQRYLFEVNLLEELEGMCRVNLIAVKTLEDASAAMDIKASTLSHLAQLHETLGAAPKAVSLNREGLDLRLSERPLKLAMIGGFQNNLGVAYNTCNDHQSALVWLEKSSATWTKSMQEQGRIPQDEPVTTANIARCLYYLNRLTDARQKIEYAIAELKKSKPLNWGGLAYASVVLAKIDQREGNLESAEARFIEAQNVWLQGDHTRLHPFNGGCMYHIGVTCLEQGKTEAAVKHLRDSMEVTRFHKERMPMEHARNLFRLSEAVTQDNPEDMVGPDLLLKEAESYLRKGSPNAILAGTEDVFNQHVNISWR
ncbi:hypothetical protein LA080_014486 [Diaporthe eres]|nr:hypothetical protein LA080_014486 [Diaporthe eres]